MAQAGYTPISLYFSTTAAAVPTSVNLANGELAINIQDEKLYFKNAAGTVKLLASNATSAPVLSFSAGTTGLTPNTATTGAVTLAGTLAVANGGTGVTTSTGTTNVVLSNNPVLVAPTLGVATATSLQGIIGNVTPAAGSFTTLGASSTATLNTLSSSGATLTGGTINGMTVGATTASSGAFTTVTASTAIGTASGGTGLSSFTSGGVVYASSTSALATGSVFTFDGANAIINATTPAYFTGTSNLAQISINRSPSTGAIFNASQSAAFINIDGASGGSSVQFAVASAANTQPSEAMRLTSTGLGIGTSSPSSYATDARNLVIASSGNTGMTIKSGATSTGVISFANAENSTSNNGIVSFNHNDLSLNFNIYGTGRSYRFQSAGTEVMRLDSAGNLGLGVTPSAWEAGYQVFENSGGSFFSGSGSVVRTVQGGYINSGYKYKYTGVAAGLYAMSAGSHQWSTAPSGTAGNAISFTQAMTLTAGGSLGVGTTNPVVYGGSAFTKIVNIGSLNSISAGFSDESTGTLRIAHATNQNIINFDTTALCFQSGGTSSPTERARIDSSGNLLVGTTSNLGGLGGKVQIDSAGSRGLVQSVNANVRLQEYLVSGSTVGFISTDGTNTTYSTSSDYRLKNTIAPMTGALAKVALLKPCTYKWNADNSDGEGFIAHELAEVCPHAVTGEKDALDEEGNPQYQGIDTSFLVATLTAAIQEQQAIIESLKARLDAANL